MRCLACGAESFHIKTVNGYPLRKCVECRLEFCWPMPSEDVLSTFYAGYKNPLTKRVIETNAYRNLSRLRRQINSPLMDFGCGGREFVEAAKTRGIEAYGVDVNAGDAVPESLEWITMWGVLEHLASPLDVLVGMRKHGAKLALTTVSIDGPIPYRHKPPEHTLYFTQASIESLMDSAGFKVVEYEPYEMAQDSDVYLDTLLRTMPDEYQSHVSHTLPPMIEVPTNEVFVICHPR